MLAASKDHPALQSSAPPSEVVTAFLEATRNGDDSLAANLLTKKALEETHKRGLVVRPPGTPTMQYSIGEVEKPENGAGIYVHSTWTDRFEEGQTASFDVTWVLREEPEGWRIAGMAAQMEEGELPLFLNFEQPDELRRRMVNAPRTERASGEAEAREPAARQAQQPADNAPRR